MERHFLAPYLAGSSIRENSSRYDIMALGREGKGASKGGVSQVGLKKKAEMKEKWVFRFKSF